MCHLMGCSNGSTIKLFERFSQAWNYIDRSSPESSINHHSVAAILGPQKENLIQFFHHQLQEL